MARKLTEKQDKFCHEFIIDCNGTQAAIRAKYSEATAAQTASRLLTNVNICNRIAELQKKAFDKTEISAQNVLESIIEIRGRCMNAEPVMIREGSSFVESGEWKFDASNALKSNELLGKHLKLFVDKQEVDISGEQQLNVNFNIPRPKKE